MYTYLIGLGIISFNIVYRNLVVKNSMLHLKLRTWCVSVEPYKRKVAPSEWTNNQNQQLK